MRIYAYEPFRNIIFGLSILDYSIMFVGGDYKRLNCLTTTYM